jgi:uncharacterized protein with NRDE domain
MCLILLAWQMRDDAPLIVAANRDEFYARPAAAAHRWPDLPAIFAGRDLRAGGTWLGVRDDGRFAAVTNFSEGPVETRPASRGELVSEFLACDLPALAFAKRIDPRRYAGFSMLLHDGDELVYTSNHDGPPQRVPPGVHGLANTRLGVPWPKVRRGVAGVEATIADRHRPVDIDALLAVLTDEHQPPDAELPERGRELEFERRVAPCFIRGDQYGTRASTVVVLGQNEIRVAEHTFAAGGLPDGVVRERLPRAGRQAS